MVFVVVEVVGRVKVVDWDQVLTVVDHFIGCSHVRSDPRSTGNVHPWTGSLSQFCGLDCTQDLFGGDPLRTKTDILWFN